MTNNQIRPITPLVGITDLAIGTARIEPWVHEVPTMPVEHEDFVFNLHYRGRDISITFLPDDNATTPNDENLIEVSAEQAKGWEVGEWWFHGMLVNVLDEEGEYLELQNQGTSYYQCLLPSFMDHNELVHAICDGLCNELDAAGVPTAQP